MAHFICAVYRKDMNFPIGNFKTNKQTQAKIIRGYNFETDLYTYRVIS